MCVPDILVTYVSQITASWRPGTTAASGRAAFRVRHFHLEREAKEVHCVPIKGSVWTRFGLSRAGDGRCRQRHRFRPGAAGCGLVRRRRLRFAYGRIEGRADDCDLEHPERNRPETLADRWDVPADDHRFFGILVG